MTREEKLYNEWLEALVEKGVDTSELELIKTDQQEITDRFYKDLTFGTAGLRGIIGLGTNRMNIYTVGRTTQGLAQHLRSNFDSPSVAIGYDSRNFSKEFAQYTAQVFAANGVQVYLYPHLVPTPLVAWAARYLKCDCGVVITASHNPAEYNGYKVFNGKGCQIDEDVAELVLKEIDGVDIFRGVKALTLEEALDSGVIKYIKQEVEEAYLKEVYAQSLQPEVCKDADLRVVYTPLNGAGNVFVRAMLAQLGVNDVHIVKEQEHPDGNFPTAPYPNPEFKEALELGLRLSAEVEADVLIATDPDADRTAIAVRRDGEYTILNGNQLGVLLLDYIAKTRKRRGTMPKNPVAVRSIVSTKLTNSVAERYGVATHEVLTGFKFVGEYIDQLSAEGREEDFIFAFEEAAGFLIGTHVRDKDAVVTVSVVAEMLSYYKLGDINLLDVLEGIYKKYGYYSNMAQNLMFEGPDGMDKMVGIMSGLRDNPPTQLVGRKIVSWLDYKTGVRREQGGEESSIGLRSSNVLEYHLEDGCGVIIRPSGTEPKLKIYYSLVSDSREGADQLEKEYAPVSMELAGLEA